MLTEQPNQSTGQEPANTTDTNSETQSFGILGNAPNESNSNSSRESIDGTPFTYVEQDGRAFIAMGQHIVYEHEDKEHVYDVAKSTEDENWILLINVISAAIQIASQKGGTK